MHTTHIIQYDGMILAIRSTMLQLARVASPKYYTIVRCKGFDRKQFDYIIYTKYWA